MRLAAMPTARRYRSCRQGVLEKSKNVRPGTAVWEKDTSELPPMYQEITRRDSPQNARFRKALRAVEEEISWGYLMPH